MEARQPPSRRLTVQPDRPRHTHCSFTPLAPYSHQPIRSDLPLQGRGGAAVRGQARSHMGSDGQSMAAAPPRTPMKYEVTARMRRAARAGVGRRGLPLWTVCRQDGGSRAPMDGFTACPQRQAPPPGPSLYHHANAQSPQNFDPRIQVSERPQASSKRLSISSSTLPCAASACLMPYSAQPLWGCSRRSSSYSVMALSYSPTSM